APGPVGTKISFLTFLINGKGKVVLFRIHRFSHIDGRPGHWSRQVHIEHIIPSLAIVPVRREIKFVPFRNEGERFPALGVYLWAKILRGSQGAVFVDVHYKYIGLA